MIADVINIAIMGINFGRGVVSTDEMWRVFYHVDRHLSVVAFYILLQMKAQSFVLSVCYSG